MSIRVAVVGLGKMGLSHLAILNALDAFEVVATCDTAALVGGVIRKYGGLRHLPDYDDVLALSGLDAVVIATPTPSHEVLARRALEWGLHVFCEKPLTLSAAASAGLADLAREKNLVTQVGYHNRFLGTFNEVKALLDGGAIGRVSHIQAEAHGAVVTRPAKPTWRGKAGGGGGCLYDYAAHPLDLLTWLCGPLATVRGAVMKSGFSAEVDDEVYATLGFENAVTAQLAVNWSDPSVRKMSTKLTLWGKAGRIHADRQEVQAFLTGAAPMPSGYAPGWTVRYITELTPPVGFYLRGEEYTAQLEAFAHAIEAGEAAGDHDFASAAVTDAAIERIRLAALGEQEAKPTRPVRRGALARLWRAGR